MMRKVAIYAFAIFVAVGVGLIIHPPADITFHRLLLALIFVPAAAALIWARWDWAPRMRREKETRERLKFPDRAPDQK